MGKDRMERVRGEKLRLGLVFGGRSVEHEVSITSATSILQALDPSRYDVSLIAIDPEGRWHLGSGGMLPEAVASEPEVTLPAIPGGRQLVETDSGRPAASLDVILPIVHGTGGEDGSLQGFLELVGIPYVGSGVLGSALQMDKEVTKRLLRAADIPVLPDVLVRRTRFRRDPTREIERALSGVGLPAFVKPACLGSSVGVSKATTADELRAGIEEAARYDEKILVEQAASAREIEVAVLDGDPPEASVPGEIVPHGVDFYDYESKYVDEATELVIPAELPDETTAELQQLALRAFEIVEGSGLARVDFFVERDGSGLWLNEVNSLPGFTDGSMYPRLWQASGLSYSALLDRLVGLALERAERRDGLERTYRRG